MNYLLGLCLLLSAPLVKPVGDFEKISWGKKGFAFRLKNEGIQFEIVGPKKTLARIFAPASLSNKTIDIRIVRDQKFESINALEFKKAKNSPPELPCMAVIGFETPKGNQTYHIQSGSGFEMAVNLAHVPKIPKRKLAAKETEVTQEQNKSAASEAVPVASPAALAAIEADKAGDMLGASPEGQHQISEQTSADNSLMARRVAVYDLQLQEIDPVIGSVVGDNLVQELRKLQGISAIGMDEIRDMLAYEQTKDLLGCDDVTCLAEIGGALGADDLITGKLSNVGDENVMLVRRIDPRQTEVVNVFNERLSPNNGEEFLLGIGPAVEQLFPKYPLRLGAERGVSEEVTRRLNPPPLPAWSTYTVGGVSVASGIVGTVFGLLARSAQSAYDDYANLGKTQTIDGSRLVKKQEKVEFNSKMANIFWISGAALAVSTGVMAFFTDWDPVEVEQ